ncbi:MAG: hypothetical protein MRZ10_00280 [Methanomassiliicoccales archaeon]|nr:hypothetical protein [Methanomassiliicoccales archaeon]
MKKMSFSVVAVVVIMVIIIAGEAYAYLPSDRGFSSSATISGDSVDYSVNANGAFVHQAILMDDGGMSGVESVRMYYDPSYASNVNEQRITAVGSQFFTQSYYIDQLTKNLRFRGVTDVTIVNTIQLRDALVKDISDGTIAGKGLVMISGAIPDILFEDNILMKWIEGGGYLYWVGNVIGSYSSSSNGISKIDMCQTMIGTTDLSKSSEGALSSSKLRKEFSYESMITLYSPNADAIKDRMALGVGYCDGGYNSVTFVECGKGQIVVFGGEFTSRQIHDVAISIASGLNYRTKVIDYHESEFNRGLSDRFTLSGVHGDLSLYISVGKYHCAYAQRYGF